jgi:hypothetical protein
VPSQATGSPTGPEFIGNSGATRDDHDIALVPTSNTTNRMYVGGGDGGSVYSYTTGGVVANGTNTRAAGARLGFQDFATANADFGVYIP